MSTTEPTSSSRAAAFVDQVSQAAPATRAALSAFAGAALLVVAGLALPWVSGPHADRVVAVGSRAGREGGIGVLLAVFAVLAALVAVRFLLAGQARAGERPLLVAGGLLALAWSVLETAEAGRYADIAGVSGGPSVGGYVSAVGAALVVAAGFLAPRDRRADRRRQEDLALRWARRGRMVPAAELLQRLITTASPVEDAEGDTLRWRLHLAEVLAVLGRFPDAESAIADALAEGERIYAEDAEEWHAVRVGAASIAGIHDPQYALGRLAELHREAQARWGAESQRAAHVEQARAAVLKESHGGT